MGKYYIWSGNLKVVMAGPHVSNAREAAKEAVLEHGGTHTKLCNQIMVSERGFDWGHEKDDVFFDTEDILQEAGFFFED